MKNFIKYDLYLQLLIYFIPLLWSSLSSNFTGNFALNLFFIGFSQSFSFIIRVGGLNKKNIIFRIYTFGYCIFILSVILMSIFGFDFMLGFMTVLINMMAILFLISCAIDYRSLKQNNL